MFPLRCKFCGLKFLTQLGLNQHVCGKKIYCDTESPHDYAAAVALQTISDAISFEVQPPEPTQCEPIYCSDDTSSTFDTCSTDWSS